MPRQRDEEPTENPQPGVPGWDCCDYELRGMSSELWKVSSQGRIVFKAARLLRDVAITFVVAAMLITCIAVLTGSGGCRPWPCSAPLLWCRGVVRSILRLTMTSHTFTQTIFKTDQVCINLCEIPVSAAVV